MEQSIEKKSDFGAEHGGNMAPKMRTRTATDITIVTIVIISAIAIITTAATTITNHTSRIRSHFDSK